MSAAQNPAFLAVPPPTSSASVAGWTVVGAGAGYGVGLFIGLIKFDDALYSDRKVHTAAIVAAGNGALAGYLIGRARRSRPAAPAVTSSKPPIRVM